MTPILSLICKCGNPKKTLATKYCEKCRAEADIIKQQEHADKSRIRQQVTYRNKKIRMIEKLFHEAFCLEGHHIPNCVLGLREQYAEHTGLIKK